MDLIYPKTKHLAGSKGVVEKDHVPLSDLPGPILTVEEKLDGIQVAIAFEGDRINLTTRSGPLPKTPVFSQFTAWAWERYTDLSAMLGSRYILWGEWLYAKHTMFYDQLDSYFYEYDIFDLEEDHWLSTPRRHEMLREFTDIISVPVLYRGPVEGVDLDSFFGPSLYQSENLQDSLRSQCRRYQQDFETVWAETADIPTEGLFVKSETEDVTLGWYKYIRPGFVEAIQESGSHWRNRPILPNLLR